MPRLILGWRLQQIKKAAVTYLHSKNPVSRITDMLQQHKNPNLNYKHKYIIVKTIHYEMTDMFISRRTCLFLFMRSNNAGCNPLAFRWQR